jgi:hypothetical protein
MKKYYGVVVVEGSEFGAVETIVGHSLMRSEAIGLAKTTKKGVNTQVFISWFRSGDGQKGYMNPDGTYSLTGQSW